MGTFKRKPTVKTTLVTLSVPESMIGDDLHVNDNQKFLDLANEEIARVKKAAKKTFRFDNWIEETDHIFIMNGVINGLTKAHLRKAKLLTFWLALEAAGVFTREEEAEWLRTCNPPAIRVKIAEAILNYMADDSHYAEDGYLELFSRVDVDGRPSGRFTKKERVYSILDISNAISLMNGNTIIKMCVADMKAYQKHLENGIGTLLDKKGNPLGEKEGKRLIDTVKAAIKNAEKDGWYETLQKTKVLNVSYVPETWTSIQ